MATVTVTLVKDCWIAGVKQTAGSSVTVERSLAAELITNGIATKPANWESSTSGGSEVFAQVDASTGGMTLSAGTKTIPIVDTIGVCGAALVGQGASGITASAGTVGSAPTTAALSSEVLDPEGNQTFKIINAVGSNFVLTVYPTLSTAPGIKAGRFGIRVYVPDYTKCLQIVVYAATEAGITNYFSATYAFAGMNAYNGWHTVPLPEQFSVGGGVPDWKTTKKIQMRLYSADTSTVATWYVGGWEHSWVARGKLLITADDGMDSWFNRGIPILDKYGLKSNAAIITSKIDGAGFATRAQLLAAYNNGHDMVVHGCQGSVNNLSELADAAAIKAEIQYHRDNLISWGMSRGADYYVYPQGVAHKTAGDTVVFDALAELGFKGARASAATGVNRIGFPYHREVVGSTTRKWMHTNVGHDSVADGVGSSMITAVMARIRALGTSGLVGHLMLHNVIAPGATPTNGVDINADDLEDLCAAIVADIRSDAYGYDVVTWSEYKMILGL